MSEPLKPCPFCGSTAFECVERDAVTRYWHIGCHADKCEVKPCTALHCSLEQAVTAWNTRHQPEPTPEQVERVAMAMNDSLAEEDHHEWQNLDDWIKRDFLSQARAAIKAMKATP